MTQTCQTLVRVMSSWGSGGRAGCLVIGQLLVAMVMQLCCSWWAVGTMHGSFCHQFTSCGVLMWQCCNSKYDTALLKALYKYKSNYHIDLRRGFDCWTQTHHKAQTFESTYLFCELWAFLICTEVHIRLVFFITMTLTLSSGFGELWLLVMCFCFESSHL